MLRPLLHHLTMNPQLHQVITFCGILIALVRSSSPRLHEAGCRLLLEQHGSSFAADRETWAKLRQEPAGQARSRSSKKAAPEAAATRKPDVLTYLVALQGESLSSISPDEPVEISAHDDSGELSRHRLRIIAPDLSQLLDEDFAAALGEALEKSGLEAPVQVLNSTIRKASVEEAGRFHLAQGVYGSAGLVLEGRVSGLLDGDLHILTSDFRHWVPPEQILRQRSRSTSDSLTASADEIGLEGGHGFMTVLPVEDHRSERTFYIAEFDHSRNRTIFFGPFRVTCAEDQTAALRLVEQSFGPIQSLPRDLIWQVYRPLLALPKRVPRARPFHFGPPVTEAARPVSSIIIPFYGDAFFLNCVFHLQRVLTPDFELVLVVDDPRIWPEIYARLSTRSTAITIPTILLQNAENYGFGRANNLGAMVARGDVLFLMNSDILVLDPSGLRKAADAIRARRGAGRPKLVVGFSLKYEDDSIQHIGMEFPRSSFMGHLYVADHPMKGLPFDLYEGPAVRTVPAVTGALMGLSCDLYRDLGGFDAVYERGDFEDADLCLRARRSGAEVELHVTSGLYHLERQSIPGMGDRRFREMITYMNCVEFNARWADHLDRAAEHEAADHPAVPRRAISVRKRKLV